MRPVLFLFLLSAALFGANSIQLNGPNASVSFNTGAAPFRRADTLGVRQIWEGRVHGATVGANILMPGTQQDVACMNGCGAIWLLLTPGGQLNAIDYYDSFPDGDGNAPIDINGRKDIVFRIVRDPIAKQWWLEIQNIDGSGWASSPVKAIATPGAGSGGAAAMGSLLIGATGWNARLAWFRMRSGSVTYGANMPKDLDSVTGYYGAWEMESDASGIMADASGSNNPLTWSGTRTYSATLTYAPACILTTGTWKAGATNILDGSSSGSLNSDPFLKYEYQQTQGPIKLRWANRSTATPSVSGVVFGTYGVWLRVTDSSGQSTTCTQQYGAVATDVNGIASVPNAKHALYFSIYGNGVPSGVSTAAVNQWPFYFERAKSISLQVKALADAATYKWDTPLAGTVSVSNACTSQIGGTACSTVTGVGTQFLTDYCSTGEMSKHPSIVLWYHSKSQPNATGQPGNGRRAYAVQSCSDNTHMVIGWSDGSGAPNGAQNFVTWPDHMESDTSGLSHSVIDDDDRAWWGFSQLTGMYYDPPEGLYWLYAATGNESYRDQARRMADTWWTYPTIDGGGVTKPDMGWHIFSEPRNIAFMSLALRAMDGRDDMWPGLRRILDYYNGFGFYCDQSGSCGVGTTNIGDLRNAGYVTQWTAVMSIMDPDSTWRAHWYSLLNAQLTNAWEKYRIVEGNTSQYNYWIGDDARGGGGFNFGWYNLQYTGYAHTTANSTAVTGIGTNFTHTFNGGNDGCKVGGYIEFYGRTHPTNSPWGPYVTNYNFSLAPEGDPSAYKISAVTDTSITLARAYEGTTADKDFGCVGDGNFGDGGSATMVSHVQPFMLGIATQGFWWARLAASAAYFNEPANKAKWEAYAKGAAMYIKDKAYLTENGGTLYHMTTPTATMPSFAEKCRQCSGDHDADTVRVNTVESFQVYSILYLLDPTNTALKDEIDHRFGHIYGKPSSGGLYEYSDYLHALDSWTGNNRAQKWFGYMTGTGKNWTWLAARIGGGQPADVKTSSVWLGSPSSVNAACDHWVTTVVSPDGNVSSPQSCTTPSCSVSADKSIGGAILRASCVSAGSVVLRTIESPFSVQ